ncbi:hypothetical protein [Corynebacterium diphtheriae]|uniref:hypothetical protein n=1 Tax=Corynebacterium diphtheriae TaxID=1717 RepID=UPI000A1F85A6|nr:hypothetical protein [Corynebacterium diphtheriae]OSQ11147.1 hypothetical protein B1A57_10485 [Corynebacterium diphtheriae]PSA75133.1 hypothetical protein BT092_09635 [Corynebacterium diphtheriae]CAB0521849.1 hypothetical protein FRC061569_01856 [Corynebacterium diphtheriae]CAB0525313.1 hypothetical protein FRC020322_02097 [Corynebacterium diphtheriae]CAB0525481.1 hypothetical protein FRC020338_02090 [Corynebacterium diphtheriae]
MSEERDMINEVPGSSPEFRTELAEQLAELVPEAVADGKIDVEKLKELLGGCSYIGCQPRGWRNRGRILSVGLCGRVCFRA